MSNYEAVYEKLFVSNLAKDFVKMVAQAAIQGDAVAAGCFGQQGAVGCFHDGIFGRQGFEYGGFVGVIGIFRGGGLGDFGLW